MLVPLFVVVVWGGRTTQEKSAVLDSQSLMVLYLVFRVAVSIQLVFARAAKKGDGIRKQAY